MAADGVACIGRGTVAAVQRFREHASKIERDMELQSRHALAPFSRINANHTPYCLGPWPGQPPRTIAAAYDSAQRQAPPSLRVADFPFKQEGFAAM